MKLWIFAVALSGLVACGDDGSSSGSGGSSTGGGGSGAGSETGGQSTGGQATGGQSTGGQTTGGQTTGGQAQGGAGTGGAEACITPVLAFEAREGEAEACLTFDAASDFCGFNSDEAICEWVVGCGLSDDVGTCKIDCEQGSISFCNTEPMSLCVIDAFCANACDALEACGFIL